MSTTGMAVFAILVIFLGGLVLGLHIAASIFPKAMWPTWDRRKRDGVRRIEGGRRFSDKPGKPDPYGGRGI